MKSDKKLVISRSDLIRAQRELGVAWRRVEKCLLKREDVSKTTILKLKKAISKLEPLGKSFGPIPNVKQLEELLKLRKKVPYYEYAPVMQWSLPGALQPPELLGPRDMGALVDGRGCVEADEFAQSVSRAGAPPQYIGNLHSEYTKWGNLTFLG